MNETLWGLVNTLIRMSAVLFIKKIFRPANIIRKIALGLLVLCILYGLVALLEIFLICRPMAVDWNTQIKGTCGNQITSYLVLEVLGLLLDFTIMVVPIHCIWNLPRTAKTKKVRAMILFSIGILQVISCLRSSLCTD